MDSSKVMLFSERQEGNLHRIRWNLLSDYQYFRKLSIMLKKRLIESWWVLKMLGNRYRKTYHWKFKNLSSEAGKASLKPGKLFIRIWEASHQKLEYFSSETGKLVSFLSVADNAFYQNLLKLLIRNWTSHHRWENFSSEAGKTSHQKLRNLFTRSWKGFSSAHQKVEKHLIRSWKSFSSDARKAAYQELKCFSSKDGKVCHQKLGKLLIRNWKKFLIRCWESFSPEDGKLLIIMLEIFSWEAVKAFHQKL